MGLLEHKQRARLFYKYLSPFYDWINQFVWTEDMRDEALSMLDFQQADRVLDIGCGTGFGTNGLLAHSNDVHALDQSIHQLQQAWDKLGKYDPVSFYLGDAERLPFADNSFDIVWSSGSIEYWPNPVRTLRECRRVSNPGGQVLIVGPNTPKSTVIGKLAESIMLFYDTDAANRMFSEAGFTEVDHRLIGPSYNPELAITSVARTPTKESRGAV